MTQISFVVTCYNFAPYIGECLESILQQTALPKQQNAYEIIVLDDASTDASAQIIKSFQHASLRFVQHSSNQGAVVTIQEGLRAARGEFVARIDGDDRYRLDFLECALPTLESYPDVNLVYGDVALINAHGEKLQDPWTGIRSNLVHQGRDFHGDEFLALVMEDFVPVPTMFMRRAALEHALPFLSELSFMDWYLVLQLAHDHPICYLAHTLADYRLHSQNRHRTLQSEEAYATTVLRVLDKMFANPARQTDKQKIRGRAYGQAYRRFGDNAFGAGQMQAARAYYHQALAHVPTYGLNTKFIRHYFGAWLGQTRYTQIKSLLTQNRAAR